MALFGMFAVLGVFLFVLGPRINRMKEETQTEKMYQAHEKLGFPEISKAQQLEMLVSLDVSPIKNLVPEFSSSYLPAKIYQKYFSISKEDLMNHLIATDYVKTKVEEGKKYPKHDGFWIQGQQIIFRERGKEFIEKSNLSESEMIDFFCAKLWQILE